MTTLEATLETGQRVASEFSRVCAEVEPLKHGVRDSEALFVYAAGSTVSCEQVLESGRHLGRSTYLYGRVWPDRRIVSLELDRGFDGAAEALARVKDLPNVYPLFGDARVVLPELTLPGDVVVIDGPKGFRALRLANRLLRDTQPSMVFMHDVNAGSPLRAYMERHLPWAFYSDHASWADVAGWLDEGRDFGTIGKGGTYACIPAQSGYPAFLDMARLWGR